MFSSACTKVISGWDLGPDDGAEYLGVPGVTFVPVSVDGGGTTTLHRGLLRFCGQFLAPRSLLHLHLLPQTLQQYVQEEVHGPLVITNRGLSRESHFVLFV